MAMKTFRYRLYPTPTQERRMHEIISVCCAWYNMCLEERILAYRDEEGKYFPKRNVSRFDQSNNVKLFRKTIPFASEMPSTVLHTVVHDLDGAFNHFFRRIKRGEKPGFPKFKKRRFYSSFGFDQVNGFGIKGNRLNIYKVGRIPVRWHRVLQGEIKTARVTYRADQWHVSFACEIPEPHKLPETGRQVGVDLGIHHMMATSDGAVYDNPKWYQEAQAQLRRLQRKLDRQRRVNNPGNYNEDGTPKRFVKWNWSNKMRQTDQQIKRLHLHIANQRKNFIDNIVCELTRDYDLIAVENLKIKNMVRNRKLAKSILNQGWGYFTERLKQKAVETGAVVVVVDPKYTSQTCSECGQLFPEKIGLSQRWVACDCGMSLDRDINAACNVLQRAVRAREAERKVS